LKDVIQHGRDDQRANEKLQKSDLLLLLKAIETEIPVRSREILPSTVIRMGFRFQAIAEASPGGRDQGSDHREERRIQRGKSG
jgi:hypothetical protein